MCVCIFPEDCLFVTARQLVTDGSIRVRADGQCLTFVGSTQVFVLEPFRRLSACVDDI
jgi:hypothetical protein